MHERTWASFAPKIWKQLHRIEWQTSYKLGFACLFSVLGPFAHKFYSNSSRIDHSMSKTLKILNEKHQS